MTGLDVVVCGGAAVDWVARVEALPQRDGAVMARSCERFPGGSAANVAVGLARLGCRVGFVGKLGDEEHGRLLLQAFREEGVDTRGVVVEAGRPTCTCFIAVDPQGERAIVVLPGASLIEQVAELDLQVLREARAVYIGPSYTAVAAATAAAAQENESTVFYAPGGVPSSAGLAALRPVLERTDVLIVSRTEAFALTGCASLDAATRMLQQAGPPVVVQTLGPEGALVSNEACVVRVPAFETADVRDTTGAGDAFAAGLVAGVLRGLDWEAAARFGCATAALKIRHPGARGGLPGLDEVLALIADSVSPAPGTRPWR